MTIKQEKLAEEELTAEEQKIKDDLKAAQEVKDAENMLKGQEVGKEFLNNYIKKEVSGSDDPVTEIASKLGAFGGLDPKARAILKDDPLAGIVSKFGDFAKGFAGGTQGTDDLKERLAKEKGEREEKNRIAKEKETQRKLDMLVDKNEKDYFKSETSLRKDFTKDYKKTFDDVTSKTKQTINALKSANAPDNVVGIMNFMKALDPGSVVRESEFKLIPEMSGLYNQIAGTLKKSAEGKGVLTVQVRKDMIDSIGKLYKVYKDQFITNRDENARIGQKLANTYGVKDYNPADVVGKSEILQDDDYDVTKIEFEEEIEKEKTGKLTREQKINELLNR